MENKEIFLQKYNEEIEKSRRYIKTFEKSIFYYIIGLEKVC
ncbi:MAG: hypothetical protein ABH873_06500 [Candidatus Firestonebacteria bacterium]